MSNTTTTSSRRRSIPGAVLLSSVGLSLLLIVPTGARSQADPQADLPQRFTATAINSGTRGPTTISRLEIVVDRWSPPEQRERLIGVLFEKGADALLDTLRELPKVGYIRTPDSLGYDLHYAQRTPLPDQGERIVLATDRYIRFWEQVARPRSIEYPFTLIEMHVDAKGQGEGKMSIATRIIADPRSRTVVLENYGTQPVRLSDVRREQR